MVLLVFTMAPRATHSPETTGGCFGSGLGVPPAETILGATGRARRHMERREEGGGGETGRPVRHSGEHAQQPHSSPQLGLCAAFLPILLLRELLYNSSEYLRIPACPPAPGCPSECVGERERRETGYFRSSRQPHSPPLLHTLAGRGGGAASIEAVRPPLTIASGAAETRYILGYGPVRARASLSKSLSAEISADFSTTTIQ